MSTESTPTNPRFLGFPPSVEVRPGGTKSVDLTRYFGDVEGFTYTVRRSRDTATATGTVSGTTLSVNGVAEGETEILVRAFDPGNSRSFAQGGIPVVVSSTATESPAPVQQTASAATPAAAPRFVDDPPAIEAVEGVTARVDPSTYFENAAGFTFTFRRSFDTAVATARSVGSTLVVDPVAAGSTELIVRATEPGSADNFAQGRIPVVISRRARFEAPEQPVRMLVGAQPKQVALEELFAHAQGYTYAYIGSGADATATGAVDGSTLTVSGHATGETRLTVSATHPRDGTIVVPGAVPVAVTEGPKTDSNQSGKPQAPTSGLVPSGGNRDRDGEGGIEPEGNRMNGADTDSTQSGEEDKEDDKEHDKEADEEADKEDEREAGKIDTLIALSIGTGGNTVPASCLKVYRVQGREEISRPFRYDIDLLCVDARNRHVDLEDSGVIDKPATLEISVWDGAPEPMTRNIHGVIGEFVADEIPAPKGFPDPTIRRYRLALVPRLAMMARNRQNRIHATANAVSLDDLIRSKLTSEGSDYGEAEREERFKLERSRFTIDINRQLLPVDPLSHVTQHNETDLDFICRLCEHHGVYFFFSSGPEAPHDMVVFGNTNEPFGFVEFAGDEARTPYKGKDHLKIVLTIAGPGGMPGGSRFSKTPSHTELHGALSSFRSVKRPLPKSIRLIGADDTGARGLDLASTGSVDGSGKGIYSDYDTHFSTQASGEEFSKIRTQEMRIANEYHIGATNSPCVAPGLVVERRQGDRSSSDRYLVTKVEMDVKQAHSDIITSIDGEVLQTGIRNTFRCIEFKDHLSNFAEQGSVFRPQRLTPIPRLPGVHTAYIASGDSARPDRPDLEEDGAYRIYSRHLDERDGVSNLRKSKPLLKAEPFAGKNVGMHFPLKQDTEVLIAYRNGDPDRPIIAGAMPGQGDFGSPVTADNETSHVIRTSTGATFEIHDDYVDEQDSKERSGIILRSGGSASREASYVRIGKSRQNDLVNRDASDARLFDLGMSPVADAYRGVFTYTPSGIYEVARGVKVTNINDGIETRSLQEHLLLGRRVVIIAGDRESVQHEETTDDDNMLVQVDGTLKVSAHDVIRELRGNVVETVEGEVTTTVEGGHSKDTGGSDIDIVREDSIKHVYANASKFINGASNTLIIGSKCSMNIGLVAGFAVTGTLKIEGPLKASIAYGVGFSQKPAFNFSLYGIKSEVVAVKVEKVGPKMTFGEFAQEFGIAKVANTAAEISNGALNVVQKVLCVYM